MPDALVLCGGAGLRLKSVTGNAPKSLASVAGRPFLELLLRQLRRYGFRRAVLAVGYQKDMIASSLGGQAFGMQLAYAAEESPLGTGGAMRNAADLVESDSALVMNGDSYTDVDLSKFVEEHRRTKADLSVVVVPADGRGDIGSVLVDPSGKLARFAEKEPGIASQYFINAGIYMVSRALLFEIPPGVPVSLEKELFPRWLESGKNMRAFHHAGSCVDIGTPERYQMAQRMLASVEAEPVPPR
jgi:D-glycero-alpha-D-manno-heptose 1-phosphate guanylyltransferase